MKNLLVDAIFSKLTKVNETIVANLTKQLSVINSIQNSKSFNLTFSS